MKLLLFACALVSCCAAAPGSDNQLTSNEATDGQLTTTAEVPSNGQLTATDEPSVSLKYGTSPFLKTTTRTIVSTPPVLFIGEQRGSILRCLQKHPDQCEVFYKSSEGYNFLTAHMEYLYDSNHQRILKCESTTKQSCYSIYETSDVEILSHAIGDGKMFVGLRNGTVLVSKLCQYTRGWRWESWHFQALHTFTGWEIDSLKHVDGWLYVGLDNGHLMNCSTTEDNACTLRYDMKSPTLGLANIIGTINRGTFDGHLWNGSHEDETNNCESVKLSAFKFYSGRVLTTFNGDLYVLKVMNNIYKCKWGNDPLCSKYAATKKALAMAFVYGTHLLQPQYWNESNRPGNLIRHYRQDVTYYNIQQRFALQVHVKNGKLYNSEGALVDTRDADEGHSGPAAIFAMSPDGTILLTNRHKTKVIHSHIPTTYLPSNTHRSNEFIQVSSCVSSLFSGSPVSGAGEMVVIDGVIKKIMACSDHYLPDLELNEQVIESLTSQGYTERIHSVTCSSPDPDTMLMKYETDPNRNDTFLNELNEQVMQFWSSQGYTERVQSVTSSSPDTMLIKNQTDANRNDTFLSEQVIQTTEPIQPVSYGISDRRGNNTVNKGVFSSGRYGFVMCCLLWLVSV